MTSAFCFCSPCLHAYCSIFYQLLVFSRMSRHLMWHPLSAPPVFMLLLQHLLVAYISHHQQQSPPQNRIHTTPPQNHESCIHRFLLPYIVSIMHNTTIAYIVSYCSKSCIIASIILLLPLFRHKFGKSRMHEINVQILQTHSKQLFKGTCPYS